MKSYKEEEIEYKSGFRKLINEYGGNAIMWAMVALSVFGLAWLGRKEKAKDSQNNLENKVIETPVTQQHQTNNCIPDSTYIFKNNSYNN
jgi:hypothetical protein